MTLEEKAKEYYLQENYNCAETLIHACNDVYDLQIAPEDMKMMGGFGGGMFVGSTCGALVALNAALSKLLIRNKAHEEISTIRPAVVKLHENFNALLGSTQCSEIKPSHTDPVNRCLPTVLLAAKAMDQTLEELGIQA